ncbi:hypothetical protein [Pseudonocardia sp. DLS-67]
MVRPDMSEFGDRHTDLLLEDTRSRLAARDVTVELTPAAVHRIADGYQPDFATCAWKTSTAARTWRRRRRSARFRRCLPVTHPGTR